MLKSILVFGEGILKHVVRVAPWVLSIVYVVLVLTLPLVVNFGYCDLKSWEVVCKVLPNAKLTEFDKWGSYLSGALVPLSLLWVGMAFRLQQHQLAEQGREQASAAIAAYEAQKITDRQTLISMAKTYVERMEITLQDFAGLVESNAPRRAGTLYGPVLKSKSPVTERDVNSVFLHLHNLLIAIERGDVDEDDVKAAKSLFVDSDILDFVNGFFEIYNEYHGRCTKLECLILIPPYIAGMASSLKYSILRSTCRWHPDEHERERVKRLIGWTEAELKEQYLLHPMDGVVDPFNPDE